jgi:hypothetical protein
MVTANRTTDVATQPNVSPLFAAGVQQRTFLSDVHKYYSKVNGFGASANEKRAARWDGGPVSNIGGSVSGHRFASLRLHREASLICQEGARGGGEAAA